MALTLGTHRQQYNEIFTGSQIHVCELYLSTEIKQIKLIRATVKWIDKGGN